MSKSKKYTHDSEQPPYMQGFFAAMNSIPYENIWNLEEHEADAEDFDRGWENGTEQLKLKEV